MIEGNEIKAAIFDDQQIVEFGYLVKEHIEPLIESGEKLFFSQANCYRSCFYSMRELFKQVNAEYLKKNIKNAEIYASKRDLKANFDRLRFFQHLPEKIED
jgi:hypothetical protein